TIAHSSSPDPRSGSVPKTSSIQSGHSKVTAKIAAKTAASANSSVRRVLGDMDAPIFSTSRGRPRSTRDHRATTEGSPTFSTGEASGRKGSWNQGRAVEGLHYMAGCDCGELGAEAGIVGWRQAAR